MMKIKDFKNMLSKYYKVDVSIIAKSHKQHKCDGCGNKIQSGSYYVNISIYANLWYRMHLSTICRAKAVIALCFMEDHNELTCMKNNELIEFFDRIKSCDGWDWVARDLGFESLNKVKDKILNLKPIVNMNNRWIGLA